MGEKAFVISFVTESGFGKQAENWRLGREALRGEGEGGHEVTA